MPFSELYFNVDNGYLEGLVRGFKAGILSQGDYLNLVQCETLEGEDNWASQLQFGKIRLIYRGFVSVHHYFVAVCRYDFFFDRNTNFAFLF